MKTLWITLVLLWCGTIAWGAASQDLADLADDIVDQANRLKKIAYQKTYLNHTTDTDIAQTLKQLRLLLDACEQELHQPATGHEPPRPLDGPRPPRPLGPDMRIIGNTSAADDSAAVLYTDAETRKLTFRKLTLEHPGGARFIRMGDIKVITVDGETFQFEGGGGKFYPGDVFEVELPRPVQISEVSVQVQHETAGLQITGQPVRMKQDLPTVVELGVAGGVKDGVTSLSTSRPHHRIDFRKLQFRHTGGNEYVRLSGLEVVTPDDQTITVPVPYTKLRPDETLEADLPQTMKIKTIRVYVQHRTDGLQISGVR